MRKESGDNPKTLEERLVKAMERAGFAVLTPSEMLRIKAAIPHAVMSSVLLVKEPEPGEGLKVAVVEDLKGETHRVLLKPH